MGMRQGRFEIFPSVTGFFRWRHRAGNGALTGGSLEPFASVGNARRAIVRHVNSSIGRVCGPRYMPGEIVRVDRLGNEIAYWEDHKWVRIP